MLTTPNLASFLLVREGFRKHAYDDAQPDVVLTEDTEIKGTLTIGVGTTHYPDGQPVRWNDSVTKQEALDYLQHYIQNTIEPALENLIHVPLEPHQYDAIGSLLYQYGEPEVSGWRLINRINRGDDWRNIILEWVTGTVMWLGRPLFWPRRVAEVLMFMGLDWRAGDNVPPDANIIDVVETMKPPEKPKALPPPEPPSPKPEPAPMNEAQKKARSVELPDDWDTYTDSEKVAWLNGSQVKPKATAAVRKKAVVETPNAKPETPPKPMEDSKTFKGLSKKESGQEAVIIGGTATVVTGAMPVAKEMAGFFKSYDLKIILMAGLAFGGILLAVGAWRWWRGAVIAWQGRQEAEGPKI